MIDVKNASNNGMNCLNGSYPLTFELPKRQLSLNISNNIVMRKEVEQLALMGAMPNETDERITAELIYEYEDLLCKIVKPITWDEAHILIKLFPPTALYGIEWTLLHLIESVYSEINYLEYRELINECNSTEFKEMLVQRLNNSQQKKVTNKA